MKPLWTALFIGSLGLNLGLLLVVMAGAASSESAPATAAPAAKPATATVAAGSAGAKLQPTVWPKLHGDDLPGLVARLRAGGFPPYMIRAIVDALLEEQFAARRKELDPDIDQRPFWKSNVTLDAARLAALAQLNRDQRKARRDLLGDDASEWEDDPFSFLVLRRQTGFLPPERARELQQIQYRYQAMSEEIYMGTRLVPAERARLAEIEKEKDAAIARLLSPQELADYKLRASPTAENLRGLLTQFNATETEFLALYRLRQPFDEKFNFDSTPRTEEWQQQRRDAEAALNEQIKAALGPGRFQDYQRSTDFNYRRASQLTARLGLPSTAADEVWAVQKDVQQRAETINKDETLSDTQRRTQLTALANEATQRVSGPLGERGFTEYQRNGGEWIRYLVPAEPAPKK